MHPANIYRKVSIQTSDPRELVVMLYDGFLKFAHRAMASLKRNDKIDATRSIGRALDIVNELLDTLDHDPAPEISTALEALYVYIGDRLLLASSRQDQEALQEVITLMSELRQGWSEALMELRRSDAA